VPEPEPEPTPPPEETPPPEGTPPADETLAGIEDSRSRGSSAGPGINADGHAYGREKNGECDDDLAEAGLVEEPDGDAIEEPPAT
jgi:hypothetical protein